RGHFVVGDRGDHTAADSAVAADRRHLAPRLHHHEALFYTCAVHRQAHRGVLDAAAGQEAEVLLIDGRRDHQLAFYVTDDAPRQDVGTGEGVAVAYCIDFFSYSKNRD